jgi:hypothetical protein
MKKDPEPGRALLVRKETSTMDLAIKLFLKKLGSLLHSEGAVQEEAHRTTAVFANPTGGPAVTVRFGDGMDICAVLHKTPRYYPQDDGGLAQLEKVLGDYAAGRLVTLDYTDRTGGEGRQDRAVALRDLDGIDLDGLAALCLKTGLLTGDALRDLLAAGGSVNVRFWDRAKDFRFVQKGAALQKEK